MRYELYYWPGIQGRGEFVRLAFEEAGQAYRDIALEPGGDAAIAALLDDAGSDHPPFAPPVLRAGNRLIGQTANILLFLGGRLELAPRDSSGKLWAHQLQLTIADFVTEAHDMHHPIGSGLYYEEQKAEAKRRARDFIDARLPKFFGYFERVLERNPAGGPWSVGKRLTYVDLSLAEIVAGVRYALPKAGARILRACPRLQDVHDRVFARPRIARYVKSGRRPKFSAHDLFRHYPELDG
jgi:glutathione S-transferase